MAAGEAVVARRARAAGFALVAVLSLVVGVGVAGLGESVAVVALAGVLGAAALRNSHAGVALLVAGAFSLDWLVYTGFVPGNAQLLIDVIALALSLGAILRLSRRRHLSVAALPGLVPLGLFLGLSLLGSALNLVTPTTMVVGLRDIWILVPVMAVPLAQEWSDRALRVAVRAIALIALLQVPVVLVQFASNPTRTSGDYMGGTIGGYSSGRLVVLMILVSTLYMGWYLYGGMPRARTILAMALLAVPPALNEAKVFFVAAPLVWATILAPRIRKNAAGITVLVVLVALLTAGVASSYGALYGSRLGRMTFAELVVQDQIMTPVAEGGVSNRLPSLAFAMRSILEQPSTMLFGHGAGSTARSAFLESTGSLVATYGNYLRNVTFAARLLLEFGLLGVGAFLAFLSSVFLFGRRMESVEREPFWRGCAVGLQGSVMTMGILSVYTDTFAIRPMACAFWLLVGVCAARFEAGKGGS
jgi:hypothetical protein